MINIFNDLKLLKSFSFYIVNGIDYISNIQFFVMQKEILMTGNDEPKGLNMKTNYQFSPSTFQ